MPRPRSPLKSLAALLDRSGALVALVDEDRQVVYFSGPCAAWLGTDAESLVGREAIYSSEPQRDPSDGAAARIAPPADAFAGKRIEREVVSSAGERRRATFLPLPLEGGRHAVLVVIEATPFSEASPESKPSSSADWHAILAKTRALLPAGLESEYLAGESPAMRQLREQVQVAARSRAQVAIVSRRGAGALEIAMRVHALGGGRAEGIVALRSPLQDAETLRSALRALARKGRDSDEQRPAILLRDVGKLSAAAQGELLGFLRQPGFEVRVLSTSRVSLSTLVRREKITADLAAALGTLEIRIPPLADRTDDVPLLAQLFLERFNSKGGKQLSGFVPEAIEQLIAYEWPGNVDDLARAVGESCGKAIGPWILASDLTEGIRGNWKGLAYRRRDVETIDLDSFLAEVERDLLQRALSRASGNKSEASRLLGVSRPRLLRRLLQLGLIAKEEAIDFQPLAGEEQREDAP